MGVPIDEEEDTCEKLSFGVFHFFHVFVHARITAGFCPFSLIFSANDSVLRAEHAQLVRTSYFLSKKRDLRVRKTAKKSGKHQTITSRKYLTHRLIRSLAFCV